VDRPGLVFGSPQLPERFWRNVIAQADGCWLWAGSLNKSGYGLFCWAGKTRRAHRLTAATVHCMPPGFVVDHLCRVRACCNPPHFEIVTNAENVQRGLWAVASAEARRPKDRCIRDHPKRLGKPCLICQRERYAARNRPRHHVTAN
jgi:hypothetical protein